MRLLFAAVFVVAGMAAAVAVLSSVLPPGSSPLLLGLLMSVVLLGLCFLAMLLFNPLGSRPGDPRDPQAFIRRLRERGLLSDTDFRAVRAFAVEEMEDEGPHYFVELEDGSVLYLNGQYLYDFEPIDDDPELSQLRRFPCTRFTILRHRTAGYVVDILCEGEVLEPELTAPPFGAADHRRGVIPEDGEIILDRTYEEVRAERLRQG